MHSSYKEWSNGLLEFFHENIYMSDFLKSLNLKCFFELPSSVKKEASSVSFCNAVLTASGCSLLSMDQPHRFITRKLARNADSWACTQISESESHLVRSPDVLYKNLRSTVLSVSENRMNLELTDTRH